MKKVFPLLFLLLFMPYCVFAARIDGPANVRETPNGRMLLSLNDNTYVDCDCETPNKKGWYLIGIQVRMPLEYKDFYEIKENEKIFDSSGNEIGKTLSSIRITRHHTTRDEKRVGQISAYTHKKNIKKSSTPVNALNVILAKKDMRALSTLRDYLMEFRYASGPTFDDFQSFSYHDPWMETETPGARITLIFDNERLTAIIHAKYIEWVGPYRSKDFVAGYRITYVEPLEPQKVNSLEEYFRHLISTAN